MKVIADAERVARYSAQPVVCNGKECHFDYVTPEQGQPVDLVLVAVKATVLEQAIKDIKVRRPRHHHHQRAQRHHQ